MNGAACRTGARQRAARGFTLIELLVACALMAVLAVLSWRGLDSVIQSRDRLNQASDELRSLTLALSQLDEDLLRAWPVRQLKLDEPPIGVAVAGEQNAQSIRLIREVNRTGMPTRIQRVVYEVRDGQLARGFGEYATGVGGTGAGGGIGGAVQALVWQPVLAGVRQIQVRGWVDGRGWLDAGTLASVNEQAQRLERQSEAAAPPGGLTPAAEAARQAAQQAAQKAASALAIIGIELVVERLDGQRFTRIYSVKD